MRTDLIEVAPGRFKPLAALTPQDRRRALAISEKKSRLVDRHVNLLAQLWAIAPTRATQHISFPGERVPLTVAVLTTGEYPTDASLTDWQAEVHELERLLAAEHSAEVCS